MPAAIEISPRQGEVLIALLNCAAPSTAGNVARMMLGTPDSRGVAQTLRSLRKSEFVVGPDDDGLWAMTRKGRNRAVKLGA